MGGNGGREVPVASQDPPERHNKAGLQHWEHEHGDHLWQGRAIDTRCAGGAGGGSGPRVGEEALQVEGTANAKARRWETEPKQGDEDTRTRGGAGEVSRVAHKGPLVPNQGLNLPPGNDSETMLLN